jgi:hypothetical protein
MEKDTKPGETKHELTRRQFMTRTAVGAGAVALGSVLVACGGSTSSSSSTTSSSSSSVSASNLSGSAWKFGVMADTQWTNPPGDDGNSPNTSAVGILAQLQQQFINAGVKFVVHVGDLCDNGTIAGEDTRALYAQSLYNAGIGFFPLRGNHDDGAAQATEFRRIYPQTQNGLHNATPSDIFSSFATSDPLVTADAGKQPVPTKTGSSFSVGSNFSSPDPWSDGGLKGLSYSFDFLNARLVLLDQFTPSTANASYNLSTTIAGQQSWISQQLAGRASASHAFVFAHKGLITCNHVDVLFGSDPSQNASAQNAFLGAMASNNAKLYIHGHDHMYDRSLIKSPDGNSMVMQILCASDSSKFYVPAGSPPNNVSQSVSNDALYDGATTLRRNPVTQELYTVGYYIITVDGYNVTVDYYAADVYPYQSSASELLVPTAEGLNFTRRDTFGYGLNGKQFVVAQSKAYTSVTDTSTAGAVAKILAGSNGNLSDDANQTPCVRVVATGWTGATGGSVSDILSLRGIDTYPNSSSKDTFVLSLSPNTAYGALLQNYVLVTLDSNGNWVNAVNFNQGGVKNAVGGPWNSSYTLGTYGVDAASNTAWAVLNHDGVFAIAKASS